MNSVEEKLLLSRAKHYVEVVHFSPVADCLAKVLELLEVKNEEIKHLKELNRRLYD